MSDWDVLAKFILIGSSSVGKSSLLVRLTDDRFLTEPDPTVGVEFGSHVVEIPETGERVKCQCWDTAGSEAFRSITRSYYRGAAGCLLVYNICHRPSFLDIEDWLSDVRQHAEENCSIILIGNMNDLCAEEEAENDIVTGKDASAVDSTDDNTGRQDGSSSSETAAKQSAASRRSTPNRKGQRRRREVTTEEARAFAEREGIMFLETSAKTGHNVVEAFQRAASDIHSKLVVAAAAKGSSGSRGGSGGAGGHAARDRAGLLVPSGDDREAKDRQCCIIV